MELNSLHNENCLETMKRMEDNFIDLIVTSPPYDDMDEEFNVIQKNGLRSYDGYEWDFKSIAIEMYRVLKKGGVIVWVINDPTIKGSESLASCYQKIYFRKIGFNIHDTMIYKSSKPPLTHNRYEQCFEYMFILSKGKPKTFNPIKVECKYKGKKKRNDHGELHGSKLDIKHAMRYRDNE